MSEDIYTLFELHSKCVYTAFVTGKLALLTTVKDSFKNRNKKKFSDIIEKLNLSPIKKTEDIDFSLCKANIGDLHEILQSCLQEPKKKVKEGHAEKDQNSLTDDLKCIMSKVDELTEIDVADFSQDQLLQSLKSLENALISLKNRHLEKCLPECTNTVWTERVKKLSDTRVSRPDFARNVEKDPNEMLLKIEEQEIKNITGKIKIMLQMFPRGKKVLYLVTAPFWKNENGLSQSEGGQKRRLELGLSLTKCTKSCEGNESQSDLGMNVKIDAKKTIHDAGSAASLKTDQEILQGIVHHFHKAKKNLKTDLDFVIEEGCRIVEIKSGSLVLHIKCEDDAARERLEKKMQDGSIGIILKNLLLKAGRKSQDEEMKNLNIDLKMSSHYQDRDGQQASASGGHLEERNLQFIVDHEDLFMEELCPSALVEPLETKGLDMEQVKQAQTDHPEDRLYQASCLLTTLVKNGEEYCTMFREALEDTWHGYLKKEWDRLEEKAETELAKLEKTHGPVTSDPITTQDSTDEADRKSEAEGDTTGSVGIISQKDVKDNEDLDRGNGAERQTSEGIQNWTVTLGSEGGEGGTQSKETSETDVKGKGDQTAEKERVPRTFGPETDLPKAVITTREQSLEGYYKIRTKYGLFIDATFVILLSILAAFYLTPPKAHVPVQLPITGDGKVDIKRVLDGYKIEIDKIKEKVASLEQDMPRKLQELKSFIESEIPVDQISYSLKKVEEEAVRKNQETQQKLQELQKQIDKLEKEVKGFENKLKMVSDTVKKLDEKVGVLQDKVEQIQRKVGEMDTIVTEKIPKLMSGQDEMKDEVRELKEWKLNTENWKKSVTGEVKVLNQQGYDLNTMMVLVIVIIILVVALVVMIMLRQKNTPTTSHSNPGPANLQAPGNILNKVTRDCAKDQSICIVSFNKSSQPLHKKLTESVLQGKQKQSTGMYLMNSHQNILGMPRSKVIIVYVDKNERNIILEDETQELGDLKRTTVEAALLMGAAVFVVYVHDDGSRSLRDGELYNSRLTSIERHRVLSKLDKQNAVLSVYDSYTQYQKEHLQTNITHGFLP